MRAVEVVGKTVEEATKKALLELGVPLERVQVEVLNEPSSGFFGLIGAKQARIRVVENLTPETYLEQFLIGIMGHMGLAGSVDIQTSADAIKMNVSGAKMGMLIGKRGATLNSLQYLLSVVYHKHFPGESRRVILDVEDYREKREETLRILALNLASKATRYRKEVILEPMNPQERRIIHTTLQGNTSVSTFSQGEEPYRKVVISPK